MKLCKQCKLPITAKNGVRATGAKTAKDGFRAECAACHNERQKFRRAGVKPIPTSSLLNSETITYRVVSTPAPPPSSLVRFGIIPDVHHPNGHSQAYSLTLRAMQAFQPEGLVVLGDFADADSLSAHPRTQKGADDFKYEVDSVCKELDILERLKPAAGWRFKKYIEGNHEWRLQRYLARNAQALMGMLSIQQCFGLHERGWEFTPYMQHTNVGKVNFTHDTGTAGMNAHRQARDVFMGSAVIGHTHRLAYEIRGVWGGPPVVTAMFGWLGDATKITYVHQAQAAMWPLGFGLGYWDTASDLVYLVPVPVVNGTCLVEGKLIR